MSANSYTVAVRCSDCRRPLAQGEGATCRLCRPSKGKSDQQKERAGLSRLSPVSGDGRTRPRFATKGVGRKVA